MQHPQVNINGSSAQSLTDYQMDIHNAAHALLATIRAACPHGRDYQGLPEAAYQQARAEHGAIERSVQSVIDGAIARALNLAEQSA